MPEKHLARFVVEIVESLNIKNIEASYAGSGGIAAYHPRTLLALVIYRYVTSVFSSRKIERATYDSVTFRYIAVNSHPDHDKIANFRKRFLPEIESFFTQILLIANAAGCLKLGTVSIDGTKIHANASNHSALSYEHVCKLEETLKNEVEELLKKVEEADNTPLPEGLDIPDTETLIIVTSDVTQHPNDKKELAPALKALTELPDELPEADRILADAGYYSEENVTTCVAHGVTPFISLGRVAHHQSVDERFTESSQPEVTSTATERMKALMKTLEAARYFRVVNAR